MHRYAVPMHAQTKRIAHPVWQAIKCHATPTRTTWTDIQSFPIRPSSSQTRQTIAHRLHPPHSLIHLSLHRLFLTSSSRRRRSSLSSPGGRPHAHRIDIPHHAPLLPQALSITDASPSCPHRQARSHISTHASPLPPNPTHPPRMPAYPRPHAALQYAFERIEDFCLRSYPVRDLPLRLRPVSRRGVVLGLFVSGHRVVWFACGSRFCSW